MVLDVLTVAAKACVELPHPQLCFSDVRWRSD
jgi:hypothetical protein